MILMGGEKMHHFLTVLGKTSSRDDPTRRDLADFTYLILKVAVNDSPLLFINKLHQISEFPAYLFKHGQGNIRPVFILLQVKDQFELFPDHRNAGFLFKAIGDFLDLVAQPQERLVPMKHAKLELQYQEVKPFGGFVFRL